MALSFDTTPFSGGTNQIAALVKVSNYLYSLIIGYVDSAKGVLNAGGSGTIVNPTTGSVSTIIALPFQFTIGEVGSLMTAGDTVLTLTYSNIMTNSESVSLDGTSLDRNLSDRVSYLISFNASTVVITFNQAVSNGQTYRINLLQYQSA